MDRSIPILLSAVLVSTSAVAHGMPQYINSPPTQPQVLEWELLSDREMSATSGELWPAAVVVAIAAGALVGAAESFVDQSVSGGQIDMADVATNAAAGAALGGINAAAALTRSAVVIVTAIGLDIAYTAARAAAEPVGPPTPKIDLSKINIPPPVPPSVLYGAEIHIGPAVASAPSPDFGRGGGAGEEHYLYF